jgi:hypothetical protein
VVVYGDGKKFLVAGVWLNDAAVDAQLDATGVAQAHAARRVPRSCRRASTR